MKSLRYIGVGAALLAVTACAGNPQSSVSQTQEKPEERTSIQETATVASIPETVVEEPSEPAFEVPEVSILKGKAPGEIEAIFGSPVLKRQDKPTEMWQYLTNSCALHLIFYPEGDKGPLSVQYISMNSREAVKSVAPEKCFESQLRRLGAEKVKELVG